MFTQGFIRPRLRRKRNYENHYLKNRVRKIITLKHLKERVRIEDHQNGDLKMPNKLSSTVGIFKTSFSLCVF
jgi:hypothetical protein